MAIIAAGECTAVFRDCECGSYFALSHCIGTPDEVTEVDVTGGSIHTKAPVAMLKSCNIRLDLTDVRISTDSGILVQTIVNDDPKAEKCIFSRQPVYGYRVSLHNLETSGDVVNGDHMTRPLYLLLDHARLTGAISHGYLAMTEESFWYETADSVIGLDGELNPAAIDAPAGVTIQVINSQVPLDMTLASGGKLVSI